MFKRNLMAVAFVVAILGSTARAETLTVVFDWEQTSNDEVRFFGQVTGFQNAANVSIDIDGLVNGSPTMDGEGRFEITRELELGEEGSVTATATEGPAEGSQDVYYFST
ncbi:MAG: hypothetical protein QGG36_25975 [Pirellulaceae bacterium]|jgi:hypothetical protein|nr:hypothetical protein [Pirellulaceae bacterium]MDP7019272.1 hypothetical protein [Pirellulaceae bacterium]